MTYHGFQKEGTYDESAILVGSWCELLAEVSGVDYHVGNIADGALEIGREFYDHVDTSFPRKTDIVVMTRAWMKFTGTCEEINGQNVSWLLGQSLNVMGQNYFYVGQREDSYFFTFRGKRVRSSDGVTIEFEMHKCMNRALFSLAGGDEAMGAPLEVEALDDSDGDYGGAQTNPLGWIWVPDLQT